MSPFTAQVWDLRNHKALQTLHLNPAASTVGGHRHPLSVLSYSPQARLLVAGAVTLQSWVLSEAGAASVRQGHREAVGWLGCIDLLQEVNKTWQYHRGFFCATLSTCNTC